MMAATAAAGSLAGFALAQQNQNEKVYPYK
jgi:hypothetical protein